MFERLRKALQDAVKSFAEKLEMKELSEGDIDEILDTIRLDLIDANVALEVVDLISKDLKMKLTGRRVPRGTDVEEYVRQLLRESLEQILGESPIDLMAKVKDACSRGKPFVVTFFGVNGVGKTTTIAKIAYMLKSAGVTPVLAESDTFRAGAQEQLRKQADNLGVPFIGAPYGSDPASVAYNAISFASSHGFCVVLIDTAGRMHVDLNLMDELKKVVKVAKPDIRVLIVDALTGNDAVEQVRAFAEAVGFDAIIVTKVDADEKGGTALSVAVISGRPIMMLGVGQHLTDLEPFDAKSYVKRLLG